MKDWRKHTVNLMEQLDFKSAKKLGQNFLIKYKVVHNMLNYAELKHDDHVLEIGGGFGILTSALVSKCGKLTVIEKDQVLANYLETTFPEIEVIHGDALRMDWPETDKIVANLPYSISSALINKIMHSTSQYSTIMLQKEVGARCIAKPGTKIYSSLSVLCNIHSNPKHVLAVTPDSFIPSPKVSSSVIHFEHTPVKTNNPHGEIELLVKNLFSLKRRTVRSVIRGFLKRNSKDNVWDRIQYGSDRITDLSHQMIDEILTFLKEENSWPLS